MNFGESPSKFKPLTGYTFAGNIPVEDRTLITQGPESVSDCEVSILFTYYR